MVFLSSIFATAVGAFMRYNLILRFVWANGICPQDTGRIVFAPTVPNKEGKSCILDMVG
jgi:hypothetical protein